MTTKRRIRSITRKFVREYDLYKIYKKDKQCASLSLPEGFTIGECSSTDLSMAEDPAIVNLAGYYVPESKMFGIKHRDHVVCACIYWWGRNYAQKRKLWPLKESEAKLVQINTSPTFRGMGLASTLISFSSEQMDLFGFSSLYARIWHSNDASIRAFVKAGWTYEGFVMRLVIPILGEHVFAVRRGYLLQVINRVLRIGRAS